MPIYEYRCQDCRRISDFMLLSLNEPFTPVCKRCGSHNMTRLLSRVHVRLSEETRLERLADPALFSGVDENDPQSVARLLKKMGPMMGEDFPGEIDQLVEEAMDTEGAGGDESTPEDLD